MLEHPLNHEHMFETGGFELMSVIHSTRSEGIIGISFRCSLTWGYHRGDSNEYTQHTIFNILKIFALNFPKSAAMEFCSKGLMNEFQTAIRVRATEVQLYRVTELCVLTSGHVPTLKE